jgi:serpin B
LTRIVLVNGIYFKGTWADKFDPKFTKKAPFHLDSNNKIEVDMMYKEAKFPYTVLEELGAHAVGLPYKVSSLFFVHCTKWRTFPYTSEPISQSYLLMCRATDFEC